MPAQRNPSPLHGVRSVFFDAAGTLFEVRGSVGEIYARIARKYGVEADAKDVNTAFIKAFRARTLEGFSVPEFREPRDAERSWWFDVVGGVFRGHMAIPALREYFDEVFEFFRGGDAWRLFPETRRVLQQLRSSGRSLGIISNFDSRLFDVLRSLEIQTFFDTVTVSWRAGAAKPDRHIFEAALQQMGSSPRDAVHVGDSESEDFDGARAAGLQAILLRRHGACGDIAPCAHDLLEVCRLLNCGL